VIKITGVSRKVDELGRIVLPIELRRNLSIETGDSLDISLENNRIILTRQELSKSCAICSNPNSEYSIKEKYICKSCFNDLQILNREN